MPPPAAAAAIAPPNMNNFTATITNTYNVAIAALLDDFPRYHASLDPRVKEEYMFSVPIPVQNKCIERWNRYAWDMSFLRSGELFQRPVNKNTTVTASERFSYEHDETCTNSGGRRESCEEKIHIMLLEEWVQWWGRETARRQVPKPTRLRRFLKHVDAHLECLIARETEDGPGWKCAEGVMRELVERLEKVVGPGLWGDGEERFIGLRLDADAPKL
ncbi:hypothetical protein BDZ91DRAFT_179342 [Kalaharituber pfeilii]|nr:hypothetical protein BDZ91DRAFT_179342 [Kalaharituber pfeilii]